MKKESVIGVFEPVPGLQANLVRGEHPWQLHSKCPNTENQATKRRHSKCIRNNSGTSQTDCFRGSWESSAHISLTNTAVATVSSLPLPLLRWQRSSFAK